MKAEWTNGGQGTRSSARLSIDAHGRVVSIQRRVIAAPAFRPQPGEAARWLNEYWRLVSWATLGVIHMHVRADGCALEVRGLDLPVLCFGTPWIFESDGFVSWALALRGGLLNGGTGGWFTCAAERRADGRWKCTLVLFGFVPRIAGLPPAAFWKPFYRWTQGAIHHLLGVVYLFGRSRTM